MCHDRCDSKPEAQQHVCHRRCDLNTICCGDSCENPMDTCETFFGRHVTFESAPNADGSFHTTDPTMTNEERCVAREGCGYEPGDQDSDGDQDWDGAGWCINNAGNECREYLCRNPRTCAAGETPVRDNCWRFNPNPETGVHEWSAREEELGLHQCIEFDESRIVVQANDGVCSDSVLNGGRCPAGTDTNDCADSCTYAFNYVCNEPDLCAPGTDTYDCVVSLSEGPTSCAITANGTATGAADHSLCSEGEYCDGSFSCYTCDYITSTSCDAFDNDCTTDVFKAQCPKCATFGECAIGSAAVVDNSADLALCEECRASCNTYCVDQPWTKATTGRNRAGMIGQPDTCETICGDLRDGDAELMGVINSRGEQARAAAQCCCFPRGGVRQSAPPRGVHVNQTTFDGLCGAACNADETFNGQPTGSPPAYTANPGSCRGWGCTDDFATNYNCRYRTAQPDAIGQLTCDASQQMAPPATRDDGSCSYPSRGEACDHHDFALAAEEGQPATLDGSMHPLAGPDLPLSENGQPPLNEPCYTHGDMCNGCELDTPLSQPCLGEKR